MKDKFKQCQERIMLKFGLKKPPKVQINLISFTLLQDGWSYEIDWSAIRSIEHEFWSYQFSEDPLDPTVLLKNSFVNLYYQSDKNCDFQPYLFEAIVTINKIKISAGFNFLVSARFKNGESFVAVLELEIREIFRNTGLSSLLKLYEVNHGKNIDASFIETYIIVDNPVFVAAIGPSLSYGYVFYTGDELQDSIGADSYLENGFIHLRKYFNKSHSTKVTLAGINKSFISPAQNKVIQQHLMKSRNRLKGRSIKKICLLHEQKD